MSPIIFDLTRFCYAPPTRAPRGIDRVELEFARYFLTQRNGECWGIVPTPWGTRCLDRDVSWKIVNWSQGNWDVQAPVEADRLFQEIRAAIINRDNSRTSHLRTSENATGSIAGRVLQMIADVGPRVGRSALAATPENAAYLNVGHFGLALDRMIKWLRRRPDVRAMFMLHDVIPVSHTEYVSRKSTRYFRKLLANTARYASDVITTTEAVKRNVVESLSAIGADAINTVSLPLAVSHPFDTRLPPDEQLAAAPYFVFCGQVEPRKNLILLLRVWSELSETLGPAAPLLIIVGARDEASAETIRFLDNCVALQNVVIEAHGLSNEGLARLISSARALLMPSFAEGFGLPIVEALSLGTPIIASDTPVHREVGGEFPTYLSPIDGPGWRDAIIAHCSDVGRERRAVTANYQPRRWRTYFEELEAVIDAPSSTLSYSPAKRSL